MLDTLDAKGYDVSAARVDFASLSSSQILMDNVEAEVDCRAPQSEANAAFASMVSSAIHVVAPQQFPITLGEPSLPMAQLRDWVDANVATVLGKRQRTLALTSSEPCVDDKTPAPNHQKSCVLPIACEYGVTESVGGRGLRRLATIGAHVACLPCHRGRGH